MARDFTLVLVGLSGKSAHILRATLERHPIDRNYQLSSLRAAILVPGLTYSGSERPEHTGRKISDSLIYGGVRGNTSINLSNAYVGYRIHNKANLKDFVAHIEAIDRG